VTQDRTLPDEGLPWRRAPDSGGREVLHLVIAWSLEEPGRAGEAAAVEGPAVLGRGGAQPADGARRVEFARVRPGESAPTGVLRGARISRTQLRLAPSEGRLEVENLGRCPLLVRGAETPRAQVHPGDVLVFGKALVLLVSQRPRVLPPLQAAPRPGFAFGRPDPHGIVGESPAAWELRDRLALAAASGHHVLLQGESGCGKELAARALHALSARAGRPLVARNAATFPEGLVDAELFGTARNYPNAGSQERPGLVGEADGSTLFLDEIGELPPPLQAHLLRLLDRGGEYQRLGESRVRTADLRVVAATNRAPESLKHDFLARFQARLHVPGLAERREDIPLLARHLIGRTLEQNPSLRTRLVDPGGEPRVDPALAEALLLHPFTHHLRELERLLWVAASTSRSDFLELTSEVAAELRQRSPVGGAEPLDAAAIRKALAAAQGSVTAAARALGLKNRFSLYRLMKQHGLSSPGEDEPPAGADEG
jgi:two-component system nitrogen regulation response regulator GlnG/two-component system response regulator HydG